MKRLMTASLTVLALAVPVAGQDSVGQDSYPEIAAAVAGNLAANLQGPEVELFLSRIGLPGAIPDEHASRMEEVSRLTDIQVVGDSGPQKGQIALRFGALEIRGDSARFGS